MNFPSRLLTCRALVVLLACAAPAASFAAEPPAAMTKITNDSAEWIPLYGEKWYNYYHPDFEGFFPGGRSNLMHDRYLARVMYGKARTNDWQIFDRQYIFDGEFYAVEWSYRATNVSNGFRQWESTLGIGRIKDGKCILWTEYFDDSVGELQEIGLMPLYDAKEPHFPWPEKAILSLPYRP